MSRIVSPAVRSSDLASWAVLHEHEPGAPTVAEFEGVTLIVASAACARTAALVGLRSDRNPEQATGHRPSNRGNTIGRDLIAVTSRKRVVQTATGSLDRVRGC